MTYARILTAVAISAALAIGACAKKEEAAPAPEAAAPAAADMATPAAATNTPAECQAYLDAVAACTAKLSNSNAAAGQAMQQAADQTKASWAAITDQTALANACKMATDSFTASAAASGC